MNFTITHITKDKVFAKEINEIKKPNWESYEKRFQEEVYFDDLEHWVEAESNLKEYELTEESTIESKTPLLWNRVRIKWRNFEIGQTISGTLITEDGKEKIKIC